MVSARSTTTFLLVFILLPLRFSSAHTQHQEGKKTLVAAKLETPRCPVNVEIYHGVPAVAETNQGIRFLPGRKMMSRGVLSKLNVVESENRTNTEKGLTTKWKALCLIGNCNREKGKRILGLKHKDSKRSNGRSTRLKMSGLVPLNADYYVPRPHPPKNN